MHLAMENSLSASPENLYSTTNLCGLNIKSMRHIQIHGGKRIWTDQAPRGGCRKSTK